MFGRLAPSLKHWLNQHIAIKPVCALCAQTCNSNSTLICDSCILMLPKIKNQCFQCGLPMSKIDTFSNILHCGKCIKTPPAFDLCISPYHYALPINRFVTQLKFQHKLHFARVFAKLLIHKIEQHPENLPDCIIPVPLHKKRLRQRGFNQALEIARPIAKHYGLTLDTHSCTRVRATPQQMQLDKQARKKNIRNAFKVNQDFNCKHVAIVDDVMTTGHTVNELARVLRKQGAQRIQIWTVARS